MPGVQIFKEVGGDSIDRSESVTYTRHFQAFTDEGASFVDVENDSRCPKYLSRDTKPPRGWVKKVRVTRDGRKIRVFNIQVDYSQNLIEKNPLDRPADIEWKEAFRQVPATRDLDDKPILNTAGDLFEGQMIDESYWIASVEKNIRPGPAPWLQDYSNTVNRDAIRIDGLPFKPGTLHCRGLTISKNAVENDVAFRVAKFELWQNVNGWQLKLWNRGLSERQKVFVVNERATPTVNAQGLVVPPRPIEVDVKRRILDDAGEPVNEPQFLDRDGRAYRLPSRDGKQRLKHPLDTGDLISLEFKVRGKRRFRELPLE